MNKQDWLASVVAGLVSGALTVTVIWIVGEVENWQYQRSRARA